MQRYTLTHREVGDKVHVLNYSLGQIMSFEGDDGRYLLANLDRLTEAEADIDESIIQFLTGANGRLSSRSFRSSLVNLGMQFGFPSVTNLELNRRCVLRCQHCYIPTVDLASKADSAFEQQESGGMSEVFDSLQRIGVFLVVLTGGEVFLNRRFQTLLREMSDRGFVVEIFSSLQFLPDWFLDLDPLETRIGRIQTSVYSVKPPIHDMVTGTPGSMTRTLKNLRFLHEQGYYVEVATPLMATNFGSRHEIEEYFSRLGIKQSFAWPIVSEYYGGTEKKALLNITKEQFLQFCLERPDYLIRFKPAEHPDESICAAGEAVMSISANGDIFSCSQFPKAVGNVFTAGVEDVYHSPAMRQIADFKKGDMPADALPYNYCVGNNYSETGDPFRQGGYVREALAYYVLHTKAAGASSEVKLAPPAVL